jgi:hypothetical protein
MMKTLFFLLVNCFIDSITKDLIYSSKKASVETFKTINVFIFFFTFFYTKFCFRFLFKDFKKIFFINFFTEFFFFNFFRIFLSHSNGTYLLFNNIWFFLLKSVGNTLALTIRMFKKLYVRLKNYTYVSRESEKKNYKIYNKLNKKIKHIKKIIHVKKNFIHFFRVRFFFLLVLRHIS